MSTLVVDDELPLICPVVSLGFRQQAVNVRVTTAHTLAEGWMRVEKDRPDVVVLDHACNYRTDRDSSSSNVSKMGPA